MSLMPLSTRTVLNILNQNFKHSIKGTKQTTEGPRVRHKLLSVSHQYSCMFWLLFCVMYYSSSLSNFLLKFNLIFEGSRYSFKLIQKPNMDLKKRSKGSQGVPKIDFFY